MYYSRICEESRLKADETEIILTQRRRVAEGCQRFFYFLVFSEERMVAPQKIRLYARRQVGRPLHAHVLLAVESEVVVLVQMPDDAVG